MVIEVEGLDGPPVPCELVADTRNTYDAPVVSPVTVALVTVEVPSAKVDQLAPLLLEYSTR
jgi:hypothetical protein